MESIKGLCVSGDANTIYQTAAAVGNFSCIVVRTSRLYLCHALLSRAILQPGVRILQLFTVVCGSVAVCTAVCGTPGAERSRGSAVATGCV